MRTGMQTHSHTVQRHGGCSRGPAVLTVTVACAFLLLGSPAFAGHLHISDRSSVRVETHLDRTGAPVAAESRRSRAAKPGNAGARAERRATAKQAASERKGGGSAGGGKDAVHGQSWGFDTGRSAGYWSSSGLDGDDLLRKAVPGGSPKGARKKASGDRGGAARSGTDAFGLSVDREGAEMSGRGGAGPDEDIRLESSHRVRAFATMKDKDVTFGVGPEVIVRDRQVNESLNPTKQPDVDAGVGMRLMIDF